MAKATHSKVFISFIFSCSLLGASFSQAQSFDNAKLYKEGQRLLIEKLKQNLKANYPVSENKGCPAGKAVFIEAPVQARVGKVGKADSIPSEFMDKMEKTVLALQQDQTKCGETCKQINAVSPFVASGPQNVEPSNEACTSRKPEIYEDDFMDDEEIRSFSKDIAFGNGVKGGAWEANCPKPCANYFTSARTKMDPNSKTHVTMVMQCGPPRTDNIFRANYDFKPGIIHVWSCQPK